MLTLLPSAGLRVSEVCGLTRNDLQARQGREQVIVFGKPEKTKTVLLSTAVWLKLLRENVAEEQPVFGSQKKGHLRPR